MLANLATKSAVDGAGLRIITPLMYLTKAETIKLGVQLGVDYSMTVTCYKADHEGRACGECDSCILRKEGFKEAGIVDPTRYYSLESENLLI
jgi:7-cyano-7-deazaguanine synthase